MVIDTINQPNDLKKLSMAQLDSLAEEIRGLLMQKISTCGGHFGSNFGMVEATIALHYVFGAPTDQIVFDVSHQSYTHKILTGRKYAFIDSEKYNEVSGYTDPQESIYDCFKVGHTSTSVSLASGLAKARDILGKQEHVVAVIGDGSLSGGEAFEGLDIAAEIAKRLIVVVNDNGMSIAENHGGIYQHLAELRQSQGTSTNNIFKALGYEYIFVEKGNDIAALVKAFAQAKQAETPIVVHISTVKGQGCSFALADKENWHWKPPFFVENGQNKQQMSGENYDNIVCEYLQDKMQHDPQVATIVAAVPLTVGFTKEKRDKYKRQFIDVGIAEQTGISMAAGMAKAGAKPVFATFSSFYQRAFDQISQDVCLNHLPVTMLVRNASVYGPRDATHLGIFDIPLLANIPNLVYLAPTNAEEYLAMLDWSIEQDKYPVAIRIPKTKVYHAQETVQRDYSELNQYKVEKKGSRVAVIALGSFFQLGGAVSDYLHKQAGINCTLINPRYITGIDSELLVDLTKNHEAVIALEDGILSGGFGEKIARFYGKYDMKVLCYGLAKEFLDRFDLEQVLTANRLKPELIGEDVIQLLGIKQK